jgi:hypothetical protein
VLKNWKGKAMARIKFGHMKCPACAERVVVEVNENETLSFSCDECDCSGYARKGQGVHALWLKNIQRVAGDAPAPAAARSVTPAAASPEKARAAAPAKKSSSDDSLI